MPEPTIRPYAPADLEACVAIFDRAWHAGHPYAPRKIDAEVFASETEGERTFVAVLVEGVAGFVSLYPPQGFIHHLYVDPEFQRRGIGQALLAAAVVDVGGRASLKCQLKNRRALAFYRRLGWSDGDTGGDEATPWIRMYSP